MHVGRYAPSPTGDLHLGNARTALLAWLWARSQGGRILLRVEDLDAARVRPDAERGQLTDLEALGLRFDGEIVRQSERGDLYAAAIARLLQAGRVYPCFCSRADVRAAAAAPHGAEGPRYPGTCRELPAVVAEARLAAGERASLRFRVPAEPVGFDDALHGARSEALRETCGDVVVRRSDGVVAYQLAVVVDDDAQGVTDVLRGDDLLGSTARQIALQQALGLARPAYAHVPLLVGGDGARLAKRHGAVAVRELLDRGVPPDAIVGWLSWTAGLTPDERPRRAADLVDGFALAGLRREPWTVRGLPDAGGRVAPGG